MIGSDSIRTDALDSCFDAFSSREPVSTSLENALIGRVPDGLEVGALLRDAKFAQALLRRAQVRLKLQRPPEIRDRARLVAKPHPGLTAIVPGIHVGRIVLQRLV